MRNLKGPVDDRLRMLLPASYDAAVQITSLSDVELALAWGVLKTSAEILEPLTGRLSPVQWAHELRRLLPARKSNWHERRILVIGNSVEALAGCWLAGFERVTSIGDVDLSQEAIGLAHALVKPRIKIPANIRHRKGK